MTLLSTGEFAKLCGVKKDTLFYYHREGILEPKYILPNGYRRYGAEQFYEYDLISILQETGSTLKEIKEQVQEVNPQNLFDLLKEKSSHLKNEILRLQKRDKMLDDVLKYTETALKIKYDALEFKYMEEEKLEIVETREEGQESEGGTVALYASFVEHFETQNRYATFPQGIIIGRESLEKEKYLFNSFFCTASKDSPQQNIHTKPPGKYTVLTHLGDRNSHLKTFKKILSKLKNKRLKPLSQLYAYDAMSYVISGSNTMNYALSYSVLVGDE